MSLITIGGTDNLYFFLPDYIFSLECLILLNYLLTRCHFLIRTLYAAQQSVHTSYALLDSSGPDG